MVTFGEPKNENKIWEKLNPNKYIEKVEHKDRKKQGCCTLNRPLGEQPNV